MGDLSRNFDRSEFRCHCSDQTCVGKTTDPSPELITLLQAVREVVGFPLRVNSGWRCPGHNRRVGGVASSAHTRGYAADLRVTSSAQRWAVLQAAFVVGARRVGVGATVIHLDCDPRLPTRVCWMYGSGGKRH